MRRTLIRMTAGAVGGALGTLLMGRLMSMAGRLPEPMRPPTPAEDPGEFMVRQGERVLGPFSHEMHSRTVHGLRWAYGMFWPTVLGALGGVLELDSAKRTLAAGALMGAVVWGAGYLGWLPAVGLTPPVHRVHPAKSASGLLSHVAYGAVAALPLAVAAPRLGV